MSAIVIETKDAMILGMAAKYPKMAKRYIADLTAEVRPAGMILANGKASIADYEANKGIVDSVLRSANPLKKVVVKAKTARIELVK
ncbi:MAG: hypothetical protein JNJ83_04480 [Verrucomicrobiaceae bacterium]|nr:hypothetical protein [Verrucomicrobiaceae bacterium]